MASADGIIANGPPPDSVPACSPFPAAIMSARSRLLC
jgi:hypothetical protein